MCSEESRQSDGKAMHRVKVCVNASWNYSDLWLAEIRLIYYVWVNKDDSQKLNRQINRPCAKQTIEQTDIYIYMKKIYLLESGKHWFPIVFCQQ